MIDEKGLQTAVDEFRTVHASNGGNLHASLRRAITAYLSARSAEPVASEIGEEDIARAIRESMQDEYDGKPVGCIVEAGCEARGYLDTGAAAEAFIVYAARAVRALLQPALDAARAEERERCAKVAESCGDTWSGSRCVEQAVQETAADDKATEIAAAIRSNGAKG